jgi:hypothetical protein
VILSSCWPDVGLEEPPAGRWCFVVHLLASVAVALPGRSTSCQDDSELRTEYRLEGRTIRRQLVFEASGPFEQRFVT